jgi:hypothetical protein
MSDLRQDTPLPSTLKIIQIGKHSLPNSLMFDELVNAPKLDLSLFLRFLEVYKVTPKTIEAILKIPDRIESDVLWSDIMKIIKRDLNSQESKLLYIFFSLQKYRLPKTSIALESTNILIDKSNWTIAKIKAELDNRIETPSKADEILKAFLDSKGTAWEDYLYYDLAIKYLQIMQPMPLGMSNNITLDYAINSIAPSLAEKQEISLIRKSEIKEIESQMKERENENRLEELGGKITKLKEEIIKLETGLSFPRDEQNIYLSRNEETVRRLHILFSESHFLFYINHELTLRLRQECPKYSTALADQQRETINKKNLKKPSDPYLMFCQCQYCYSFRFEPTARNGKYRWHCGLSECRKAHGRWKDHLESLDLNPSNV